MRVLLDESMPRRFAQALAGHDVITVRQMGWTSVGNGELLRRAAAAGFGALVTVDQSLEYQQNVARAELGVIVIIASSNRIVDVLPAAPSVLEALAGLQPGQVVRVGTRRSPGEPDRRGRGERRPRSADGAGSRGQGGR